MNALPYLLLERVLDTSPKAAASTLKNLQIALLSSQKRACELRKMLGRGATVRSFQVLAAKNKSSHAVGLKLPQGKRSLLRGAP